MKTLIFSCFIFFCMCEIHSNLRYDYNNGYKDDKNWDWRDHYPISSVDNELISNCSSSYIFAALSGIEGVQTLENDNSKKISSQEYIDCSGSNSCKSDSITDVFDYYSDSEVCSDDNYKYNGERSNCQNNRCSNNIKIKKLSYTRIKGELAILTSHLVPIPTKIYIDSLKDYRGGIYKDYDACNHEPNHWVSVIGFGTEGSDEYWIIKNDYGEEWGENGYLRLQKGKGMCGIGTESYAVYYTKWRTWVIVVVVVAVLLVIGCCICCCCCCIAAATGSTAKITHGCCGCCHCRKVTSSTRSTAEMTNCCCYCGKVPPAAGSTSEMTNCCCFCGKVPPAAGATAEMTNCCCGCCYCRKDCCANPERINVSNSNKYSNNDQLYDGNQVNPEVINPVEMQQMPYNQPIQPQYNPQPVQQPYYQQQPIEPQYISVQPQYNPHPVQQQQQYQQQPIEPYYIPVQPQYNQQPVEQQYIQQPSPTYHYNPPVGNKKTNFPNTQNEDFDNMSETNETIILPTSNPKKM